MIQSDMTSLLHILSRRRTILKQILHFILAARKMQRHSNNFKVNACSWMLLRSFGSSSGRLFGTPLWIFISQTDSDESAKSDDSTKTFRNFTIADIPVLLSIHYDGEP